MALVELVVVQVPPSETSIAGVVRVPSVRRVELPSRVNILRWFESPLSETVAPIAGGGSSPPGEAKKI